MKIGKLAQTDIALCRLRVTYILCQSRLADKGDNQSDMQPAWECVSHSDPNCNFFALLKPTDLTKFLPGAFVSGTTLRQLRRHVVKGRFGKGQFSNSVCPLFAGLTSSAAAWMRSPSASPRRAGGNGASDDGIEAPRSSRRPRSARVRNTTRRSRRRACRHRF